MKFRIKWFKTWTLQYHWDDENGGGWNSICSCPFRWPLRIWARVWRVYYKYNLKLIGYKEEFEL